MNLYKSLLDKVIRRKKIILEQFSGLDLTKSVDNKSLGLDHFGEGIFYATGNDRDLIEVLDDLQIKPEDRILDYGAGKGAAMVVMDKYDFSEVAGVEISTALCKVAEKNFNVLKKTHLKVYESDATQFQDIDRFSHYYFFHPFNPEVTELVLDNIQESLSRKPRQITLIYYNPAYNELFDKREFLFMDKRFKGWKYETLVYRNVV